MAVCGDPAITIEAAIAVRNKLDLDLSLFGVRVLAIKDDDVAQESDEMGVGFPGELGGEDLSLVLELGEFHFDQFVA